MTLTLTIAIAKKILNHLSGLLLYGTWSYCTCSYCT